MSEEVSLACDGVGRGHMDPLFQLCFPELSFEHVRPWTRDVFAEVV